MALDIDGPQSGILVAAIQSACPTWPDFDQVLRTKLNDSYTKYTGGLGDRYPDVCFRIVIDYNAHYHIDQLVVALMEHVPDNEKVLNFAWQHNILKRPGGNEGQREINDGTLERMLDPERGFTDAGQFLRRCGEIVNRVCRIKAPGTGGGTGFLIGNGTVLTNWHVVEYVNSANRNEVKFLFDYRTGPDDGQTLTKGIEFGLIDDDERWLIDYAPYHSDDLTPRPIAENLAGTRPEDKLDYAIIRLAGDPGAKPVGAAATQGGLTRGYLSLTEGISQSEQDFAENQAAFIFQHPSEGGSVKPLQIDWEKPAILGVNKNLTRVFYNINTRPGSSGSPCFNAKLELIALHHAGGRDWPAGQNYLYNQGIPIRKISSLLEERGKLSKIK